MTTVMGAASACPLDKIDYISVQQSAWFARTCDNNDVYARRVTERAASWLSGRRRRLRLRQLFAHAGLLDELDESARPNRISVLALLVDHGATVAELTRASNEGRLAHLLLEDALTSHGAARTLEEISRSSGISVKDLEKWFRAIGRGVSKTTAADYTDEDLRLARLLAEYRALGLEETSLFALVRIIGRNIWAIADAAESLL